MTAVQTSLDAALAAADGMARAAGGCGCRLPRWDAHRLVCGVEFGVAG